MERIVLEGTQEQIKNALELLNKGNKDLPTARTDYQTENLWTVEDAQHKFKCDKDEALELLHSALTNEATMEQIWLSIDMLGEDMGLERND